MHDEAPSGKKHGTFAVLALLLSVLFTAANVPAARVGADGRFSSVGQAEKGKSGAVLRAAYRHSGAEQEEDDPFTSSAGARVETRSGAVRPLPDRFAFQSAPQPARAAAAYRARAPPAAA